MEKPVEFSVPDPKAKTTSKNIVDQPEAASADIDVLFTLSKAKIKSVIDSLDAKTLAYSLIGKSEEDIKKLLKKLPENFREELETVRAQIKKPRKETLDSYKNKVSDLLKSLF
jgi:Mg/Co/Ni transporter MgtE